MTWGEFVARVEAQGVVWGTVLENVDLLFNEGMPMRELIVTPDEPYDGTAPNAITITQESMVRERQEEDG